MRAYTHFKAGSCIFSKSFENFRKFSIHQFNSRYLQKLPFSTEHYPEFKREHFGYLFGLKPGEKLKLDKDDWMIIRAIFGIFATAYLVQYKSDDTIKMWAHKQAAQRMLKRGIDITIVRRELSDYFNMDLDRLIELWQNYEKEYGVREDVAYIVDYPRDAIPFNWMSLFLTDIPMAIVNFFNKYLFIK